ncbi:MAG TPA: LemA family protein [Enteractinococcus sp.]
MGGSWGPILLIGVVILILVIWGIVVYNRLIKARNASKEALRGIDVALETRFDQIKAQADAASGIVQKEVDLILGTTALRTGRTISQLEVREKAELTAAMQEAEQQILQQAPPVPGAVASIEAYPDMNTYQNVELLQRTINEAEERLQAARRVYNRAATDYNTKRQVFPTVLISGMFGFQPHELFELTDQRKKEQYNLEGFLDS